MSYECFREANAGRIGEVNEHFLVAKRITYERLLEVNDASSRRMNVEGFLGENQEMQLQVMDQSWEVIF